ncbi:MAG TPA: DNA mismatch repair endonuclease MutL [Candidatus Acidoferrales bacterium]|nr:DNA mismatch repair endonuclease MutL [Candidatus Acidoferrales bacterium]
MKIILLPESWARRIAAGEVVERPASVVKELVENSLDAGATEISVALEGNGVALIRVSDNGEGMALEDLVRSVERHATSKIKDESDLYRIRTLGFRGEALPSIGAVAKLEIRSRARGQPLGYRLRVEGGVKDEPVAVGCAEGTTVEVRELFFNTPARRKFLKSPQTELGQIGDVINRMALAFPEVHFRLEHAAGTLSDYVATGNLADRLRQVFGADMADGTVALSLRRGEVAVTGYLSAAPFSAPSARYLLTYVNRRFVRDRVLTHAVLEGYETLLMKGRYPAAAIFVSVPFGDVDVNVHPGKYEVRFRRQGEIHDAVADAVRESLREKAKAPVAPGRGRELPAEILSVGEPADSYRTEASASRAGAPESLLPFSTSRGEVTAAGKFFSSLEVLGQLLGCYLVCAAPSGLVLIDQHAAHERVAFEKMRRQMGGETAEKQRLLWPQIVDLPYAEALRLEQMLEVLEQTGFSVEAFGKNTFALRAIPALLPQGDYRAALRRMVAEATEIGRAGELRRDFAERLMTIACHGVIRANRKLQKEEMQALLASLDQCDFATQCPHGRPVLVEFSQAQLERLFRRA